MADPRERDLDPDAAQRAIEYCFERGWTDGLPVVPASRPLVDRFLAQTDRDPGEVIGRMEHLGRECTVELAAINAAMAGCRPEHFPVVLAAWEALMLEGAARSGAGWQSTSGPAPFIVVNGPVRSQLGFNSAGGVFGPGFRANATVPRAIGLIVRNAFGILPQVLEQATQGVPGRWSICIAENEEESPWEPLAVDGGLDPGTDAVSATLIRTCEFVDNRHTQDPEQVLWDFADTISRTGALIFEQTSCRVVFCPEHAQMLARAGYSRAEVKRWFHEHCGRLRSDLWRAARTPLRAGCAGPATAGRWATRTSSPASCPRPTTSWWRWRGPGPRPSRWWCGPSASGRVGQSRFGRRRRHGSRRGPYEVGRGGSGRRRSVPGSVGSGSGGSDGRSGGPAGAARVAGGGRLRDRGPRARGSGRGPDLGHARGLRGVPGAEAGAAGHA